MEAEFKHQELYNEVERHTAEARAKFLTCVHLDLDLPEMSYWMAVIGEEYGKLCQCSNKLAITLDGETRNQWRTEARHRIITSMSLLRRLYDRLDEVPKGTVADMRARKRVTLMRRDDAVQEVSR